MAICLNLLNFLDFNMTVVQRLGFLKFEILIANMCENFQWRSYSHVIPLSNGL